MLDGAGVGEWMRRYAAGHGYELDSAQLAALPHFQQLYEDLVALDRLDRSLLRLVARKRVVKGIYLYGGVGRGKSFLMDSFFLCAPTGRRRRVHFHRFMQEIHHHLHRLQGRKNPLIAVAKRVAAEARLLCLDEMHVTDITDAMLMRNLLEGLFAEAVVLVTTSNVRPCHLYRNGLQRGQFLPAIELLESHLTVIGVDGGIDYRLRALERAGVYHVPHDAASEAALAQTFVDIARHVGDESPVFEVDGRVFTARRASREVVWFDFRELCDGPRGKADYIELARRFHTVILSDVPKLTARERDLARRFVWLIDEFYDRRVKLILSAAVPVEELFREVPLDEVYEEQRGSGEFDRTVSRLVEMQTHDYLGAGKLP